MKIGVYCRVSGLSQRENTSLENQKSLGIKFCNQSGYEYEVFTDVESGGKIDRKVFSKLLDECKSGKIDGIWVYDNDRLSRDYDVGGEIRKIIVDSNLRLFIGWEEVQLEESKDRFNYNIRSVMSDYEKLRINERFNYGKQRSYKNGKGLGMLGLGYSKDKFKNVIVVEEEKKIIIDIYKIYLRKDVKTYSDVSKRIISKYGEVINGKRITESRIGLILKDEKFLGKVYRKDFEGNVYEFDIGKIIDDELWNEVLEKRNKVKIINKNVVKKNYLLKGKVNCGCCGSNMWIKRGGKNTNGVQWSYYYCNNIFRKKRYDKKFNAYVVKENTFRKNKQVDLVEYEKMYGKFTNCSNVKSNTISVSKLEELVWVSLYDFLLLNDKIKNEYKIRFEEKLGSKDKFSGKLKYYKEKLSKEKDKKMLMYDKWLEGKVTDEDKKDYDLRNDGIVNEIKGKVKSIQSELDNINNNVSVDSYIDLMKNDIKNELNVNRFEDKRRVIDKYVNSVKVKLLNYNTKMKEYEIIIELFNDNIKHKLRLNDKLGYHLKNELAQTLSLNDKQLVFKLLYNYRIFNIGLQKNNAFKNKRILVEIN